MSVKKQTVRKQLNSTEKFSTKAVDGGDLFIEGWANRAVVDRGGEIIKKEAWNLENFNKNPMMLFNHDKDKPIGKIVECQAQDGGLWVKGKISKSKDPLVSYVRDLVSEGILSTFSVGFDGKDEQKDEQGAVDIKSAELFEVSIVTLPMNQDSSFGVSMKSLSEAKNVGQARAVALRAKGALVAASIQEGMYDAISAGKTRDEILARAAEISNLSVDEIKKVLVGDVTPVPEGLLYAFSEALGVKLDLLKKLNAGDAENEGNKKPDEVTPPAAPAPDAGAEDKGQTDEQDKKGDKPEDKPGEAADAGAEGEGANKPPANPDTPPAEGDGDKPTETKSEMGIVSLHIPKSAVTSSEEASAWAEDNGFSGGVVDETDDEYVLQQNAPEDFEGEAEKQDIGDGVYVMIAPKKSAEATEETEGEKGTESQEKALRRKEGAPPASDGQGNGIPGNAAADRPTEDPMMDQVKQTNVLLTLLIEEVKKMNAAMVGLVKQNTEQVVQDAPTQDTIKEGESDEEKAAEEMKKHLLAEMESLKLRVKTLKEATV